VSALLELAAAEALGMIPRGLLGLLGLLFALCAFGLWTADAHRKGLHTSLSRATRQARSSTLEDLSKLYHSTDQLMTEYRKLAVECPGMEISSRKSGTINMPIVRIKQVENPAHRSLFFFGEHARELISTESGLAFARALCDANSPHAAKAKQVLKDSEVLILPSINQDGRSRVEHGEYCVRGNGRGVDLNRNWNDHWELGADATKKSQAWGGKAPFSEPETQILRSVADEYKPTIFLTVHSGTLGMYMPYAYSTQLVADKKDREGMLNVLSALNKNYCACSAGSAGKEVGYLCSGTCLDYMYDKLGTKFAFGYEIWDGETKKGYSNVGTAEGRSFLEVQSTATAAGHRRKRDISGRRHRHFSCFLELEEGDTNEFDFDEESLLEEEMRIINHEVSGTLSPRTPSSRFAALSRTKTNADFPKPTEDKYIGCLTQFNPTTKASFEATLDNWVEAFLDTVVLSMQAAAHG